MRPTCQTEGCSKPAALIRNTDKGPKWRKWCTQCHSHRTAELHGLKTLVQVCAKNAGMTVTQYTNQWHPYLKFRKDYCENQDGRLGFKCTTTIFWQGMLDVDHINGDPEDHREANLQTLCKCCHAYKTVKSGDYATPGRKSLKQKRLTAGAEGHTIETH